MIVSTVNKIEVTAETEFIELANQWLIALAQLPGWVSGSLGRSVDEVDTWLIQQEWQDAGSCRRGLSASQLRPIAFAIAQSNISEISTFEQLLIVTQSETKRFLSDRAVDADTISLSTNTKKDNEV